MKDDKRLVAIVSLFAVGLLFLILGIKHSVGFILIAIVPIVIANRVLFSWENKKGKYIFAIIGIVIIVVGVILKYIVHNII